MILDTDLSQLLKAHPEKGLEVLIENYMGLVYTIVYSKLHSLYSQEDIEECVSDIFLEAYSKREALINLEKGAVKAYLATMARRRAIDLHRRLVKTKDNIEFVEENVRSIKSDTEERILNKELQTELLRMIESLGEPDSEIIIRKYYFEQKTKEISKVFGLKENTVDKKLSRALAKLKQIMGGDDRWKMKLRI